MFRHIVLMNWNDQMTADRLAEVGAAMTELGQQCSSVISLTHGPDAGVKAGGCDYALVGDFADADGWREYSAHPAHDVVRAALKGMVASQQSCQLVVV